MSNDDWNQEEDRYLAQQEAEKDPIFLIESAYMILNTMKDAEKAKFYLALALSILIKEKK